MRIDSSPSSSSSSSSFHPFSTSTDSSLSSLRSASFPSFPSSSVSSASTSTMDASSSFPSSSFPSSSSSASSSSSPPLPSTTLLADFLAGCVGGAAGVLSGYPLDTIKVRLQTQSAQSPVYKGTFSCFRCILRQEGPGAFYKGMSSPLASLALINALIFGVHGHVAKQCTDQNALGSHFIAGAAAGAAQAFIASPMEMLKLRAQLHQQPGTSSSSGGISPSLTVQNAPSPYQLMRKIVQEKGIRHLSRGLLVTQLRDSPAMGVYFTSFECLGRWMSSTGDVAGMSSWQLLLAGGGAGMLSWLANYPADVIKTRYQADDSYRNYADVIRRTYAEGGLRCFYAGLGSTLIRAFPTNAATFFAVEWTYRLLLRRPVSTAANPDAIILCQRDEHWPIAAASLWLFPEAGCTLHEPILLG